MKYLLPPSFAVIFSTAGTAFGCHIVGMPIHDVKLAAALAFVVSSIAAFGAVFMASRREPTR